ncbi:hypothetical protein Q3G72_020497 [Acer saccharum]|nr:hypothetical protein Q3G72_020497 [Acer saccharum]
MPTIGRAEITVVYDGKDLPRQARELGEESGESFGEEHANAADKEIKDGLDDTLKDAEKRSGESGDRGGKNFGVKYSDAADKVMKQRLSKTADDVAKVFTDDKGIEKFVQGYKGAGTATDDLREKLDSLHESNVIGSKDYDELGGKLQGYVRELEVAKRSIVDQKDAHVEAYERINEMIEVNSKARDRLHDQIDLQAKQATDAIDQSVDRQVEAYEKKYGPAIDAAGERVKTLGERVDVASKKGNDGSLSNFLTRLDDFDKNRRLPTVSGDLEKLGDSVEKSGASINRNRGFFGGLADNVGRLGRTLLGDAKTVGTDIEKIGAGVARGGDDAAGATPKFGSLFRTFSSFDPSDNIGQLLALIVAFAPQIAVLASGLAAGLLIIAGGVAALALAVGGGVIGFSNFMGDVGKLPTGVQPAARAVQSFVGDFKDLRSELQEHMFAGLGGEMGKLSTELIPALKKDFGSLGDALHDVLGDMTRDVTSSGFKNDLRDIFAESKPVIRDLGTIARESFGIIGQLLKDVLPDTHDFTKGVADALGKFNEFLRSPEGKRAVQDWLNDAKQVLGKLGDAIGEVAKAFGKLVSNPKNLQDTINSLEELGKAGPALLRTGQNLSTLAAAAVKAIGTLSSIFENASKIADPFLTGLEVTFTAVVTKARTVVDFFRDIFSAGIKNAMDVAGGTVKAFKQITDGDFVGAGKTIADTTAKVKTNLGHVSDAVRSMGSDGDAAFDKLGKSSQNNLTAIANKLGYTGDDAKKFGGRVSEVASAGGVDLADLKTKGGLSMDQLASKLGLTEGAAKTLLTDGLSPASTKGSAALADLKQKAGTNLDGISNSLGLTGKDAKTFKGAKLAGAKSWDDIYSALASGGSKSRTEFANKIIASANDSGRSIDDLPPKIRSLVEKYGTIPAKKNTDVTLNDQASSKANSIAHAIDSIQNRNVTVAVYYEQHGTNPATGGAKYGAKVGGIMVGGNIVAGGQRLSNGVHAFANGGILRSPLRIGNTLAGEAGAEAIVPLTGSLKQVDRSVRDLAAYARGHDAVGERLSGRIFGAGATGFHRGEHLMYEGYLELGGVPLINVEATEAYVAHLAPNIGLKLVFNTDQLHIANEESAYRTPLLDEAPWVNLRDPVTHGFLGLYPTSIQGIDDSSLSASVTEYVTDGGSIGSQRLSTKSIRVAGLLVGMDKLSVHAGLDWLKEAVRSGDCSDCGEGLLRYFRNIPDVCEAAFGDETGTDSRSFGDLTPGTYRYTFPSARVDSRMPMRAQWDAQWAEGTLINYSLSAPSSVDTVLAGAAVQPLRRNYIVNPTLRTGLSGYLTAAGQTAWSLTGGVDGASFGRMSLGVMSPFAVTPFGTGGFGGGGTGAAVSTSSVGAMPAGSATVSVALRSATSSPVTISLLDSTGKTLGSSVVAPGSDWGRFSVTATVPAGVVTVLISTAGAADFDQVMLEAGSRANAYFDGSQLEDGFTVSWEGAVDASVSRREWASSTELIWEDSTVRPTLTIVEGAALGVQLVWAVRRSITMSEQLLSYERHLFDVVCTQGPQVMQEINLSDKGMGVFLQVEFTLTAGNPSAFSLPELISTTPLASGTYVDPDVAIEYDDFSWLSDPNSTVVTRPPSAPIINNPAIESISTWRRYYVPIPAQSVADWAESIPTMALTSKDAAITQVRVRFHPNPFDYAPQRVDPQSYCSEFVVSYLPALTRLEVDGVFEQATASRGQNAALNADHLLYGSDGGPITWPRLSCAIPYVLTIDVPPTSSLDAFGVDLSLRRKAG